MSEQPTLSTEELQDSIRSAYKNLFPNFPDEAQVKEFLEAVGSALAEWSLVEMAIYQVFLNAIGSTRNRVVSAAYYTLQHTKSQLEMTDAAVRALLVDNKYKSLLEEWDKIEGRTGEKLQRRNKLVHNCIYQHFDKKHDNDKITSGPPLHDYRYAIGLKDGSKAHIRLTEIQDMISCFNRLHDDLNKFSHKIPPPSEIP